MFSRKKLKETGRKNFFKNYWCVVAVCFLLSYLTGVYATSTNGIHQYDNEKVTREVVYNMNHYSTYQAIFRNHKEIPNVVKTEIDSWMQPVKYLVQLGDSIIQFINGNFLFAIACFIGGVLYIGYYFFFASVFRIGCYEFFIENHTKKMRRMNILFANFKKGKYLNTVKVMFLRKFYLILWCFTIVGGIVKYYEYRMIPYILAEDSHISFHDAHMLSKKMMQGMKWKTFLLDASYLGWYFLSVLTFGFLSIFYVNPYKQSTEIALYKFLRENQA